MTRTADVARDEVLENSRTPSRPGLKCFAVSIRGILGLQSGSRPLCILTCAVANVLSSVQQCLALASAAKLGVACVGPA